MADNRLTAIAVFFLFLLLIVPSMADSQNPVPGQPGSDYSTQCPSNQYAYNETSSGTFTCSQVSYSQLVGTPIETSSQCPPNEYVYNETTLGTLVCSQVSFAQLSGKANFQTQLNNFPSGCPTYPEQFPTNVSASLNCQLPPQFNSTGLVGYWPLTEGSGNYAYDLSGNGNTGTLVNSPSWVTSCHFSGSCLNFDGSARYVSIPNSASLQTSHFTTSFWVKRTDSTTLANMGLVSKCSTSTSGYCSLFSYSGSTIILGLYVGGELILYTPPSNSWVTNWNFITYGYDGTNMFLYVNGVFVSSAPSPFTSTTDVVSVGQSFGYLSGSVDDVRIYSTALTSSQISQLYNSVPYPFETQLYSQMVNSWRFQALTVSLPSASTSTVVTMPYSEPNTSYQVVCSVNALITFDITTKTATTFTINYAALATTDSADCIITHS